MSPNSSRKKSLLTPHFMSSSLVWSEIMWRFTSSAVVVPSYNYAEPTFFGIFPILRVVDGLFGFAFLPFFLRGYSAVTSFLKDLSI